MAASSGIRPEAAQHLTEVAVEIHNSIFLVAAELAKRDQVDEVHKTHIDEARKLLSPKRKENRQREVAKILGGALLGAFFPGFYSSLAAAEVNTGSLIVYVAFGFIGLLSLWYGYR
jgi:hypothetical protein